MEKRYLNWKGYIRPMTPPRKVMDKTAVKSLEEFYKKMRLVVMECA